MNVFRTILFTAISGIALVTSAQDVGLPSMIYPVPNQKVHLMFDYPIEFVVKNYGPKAIPGGAGMSFVLLFDGQVQPTTYTWSNNPKINPGDSVPVAIPAQTLSTPNPTIEVGVVVTYTGDNNKNNDTILNVLNFSVDNNIDRGPTFLDIIVPNVDSVITPGESIILMRATISNFGSVTLPRNDTIQVETKMYNQTRGPFKGITKTAFDSGSTFTINLGGQQPKVQSNNGPFQICVTILDKGDDKNPGNDEYCQIFYAYDWTGIAESDEKTVSSYSSNGNLQINRLNASSIRVQIYSITGRLVLDKNILSGNAKGTINISHLNSGVYILKVLQENRLIHTNKFTIDW